MLQVGDGMKSGGSSEGLICCGKRQEGAVVGGDGGRYFTLVVSVFFKRHGIKKPDITLMLRNVIVLILVSRLD